MDQKEWLALAKRGALDAMLSSLFDGTIKDVAARVAVLAKRKPDPRIAAALTEAVKDPAFTSTSSMPVLWTPLFTLLAKIGDAEVLAELAPLADDYDRRLGSSVASGMMQAKLKKLLAALVKRHGPASPAKAVPKQAASRVVASYDALLEDVLAVPEDDRPRAVLADFLQERGDPRGEFIVLQLRGGDAAREAELLAMHKREWIGAIADAIDLDDAKFARGFVESVSVAGRPRIKVATTAGHPTWGTVRRVTCTASQRRPIAVLTHPVMRALRTITGLDELGYYDLAHARHALPVEEIDLVCWSTRDDRPLEPRVHAALTDAHGLTSLARLQLNTISFRSGRPDLLDFFWKGALAQRLDSFAFRSDAGWVEVIAKLGLTSPRRIVVNEIFELTPKTKGGRLSQLFINYPRRHFYYDDAIIPTLENMTPGLFESITIDAPSLTSDPTLAPRLTAALARARG